ncbi:MAG: translocation/assembly module TamB domain-containing protein, partial [Sphingomonadaceae bacterium]|nr:translocation/assembly module TamB domain-containing protein [Sphingomonadaceae bacterium]
MKVVTAGRGFGIRGRVAVKTRRIDNASARGVLEGNATATADVVMDPNGIVHVANLRLSSPGLRVTSGSGTYTLGTGAINFRGAGVSRSYGVLAVIVTGTATRPNVQLRAANPGFGLGLRNVSATVRSTAAGYVIHATGQSDYGPFAADLTILAGRGLTTFDISRLTVAGMTFAGRVVQTRAGPFAGTLTMTGSGLNGVVRLSAAGRYQRADINATANGARIPGANPILIQRGLVQATIILYPNAPQIVGDVQLAGVRTSSFSIAEARVRANYQSGRGTAQIFAQGTSGVPFSVGVNAALTPDLVRAAMQGSVDNIPFHLAQPALIQRAGSTWVLTPTQVVLQQGNVLLAGRYGPGGYEVQSRMEGLDLSILNVVSPTLGIGGKATGSLDFAAPAGAAFPRAEARLNIAGFTRTGVATRTPPVDLSLLGTLQPAGGALDAVIRSSGTVIGRAQVRLQPVGAANSSAGSWMSRLTAAPLSGGIRYNGPGEVLSSLAGLANQQLSGPIGVAADFSGRLGNPQLNGIVRANNLTFVDEHYGTRITGIALQGRFTNSTLQIEQLSGHAGKGTISGQGTVGFAAESGYPIDIRMRMQNAQLARSDNLAATVSGDLAITNNRTSGALISGNLQVANLRYQIVRQGAAEVIELQGVRRKGQPLPTLAQAEEQAEEVPSTWKLDLRVHADNQMFISGMGLESEWNANLRIRGTTATPQMVGRMEVVHGTFSFSGQDFDLSTGNINFTGARPPDPQID